MSADGQVSDVDTDFVPIIHKIIKCIEKDPQDASAKNKESLEASQKIQDTGRGTLTPGGRSRGRRGTSRRGRGRRRARRRRTESPWTSLWRTTQVRTTRVL